MDDATALPDIDGTLTTSRTDGEAASDQGVGMRPDTSGEAGGREAMTAVAVDAADSAANGDGDASAEAEAGVDAGNDAGNDAGSDVGSDSAVTPGPRCPAADGGFYFCNANEHCCANPATRVSTCASSCDTGSGSYPLDCPGASGAGGCGSQLCCGTLVFNGGAIPSCNISELTSICSDSCIDNFPGVLPGCAGSYVIRLCTSADDCMGNPNGNTSCCNFGNPPVAINWCVAPALQSYANICL